MIGKTIFHYKILEKLGEGGMGVVYKAQDTQLDRIVALKFLPRGLTSNEGERARFLQEAKAASALNHPNVSTIYRIDEYEGEKFIEMEYVDGQTLREIVEADRENPLRVNDVLAYAIQIGEALQEAHSKNIVHRDIKCENIMVNSKNQVKVMDFGLAKLKGSLKLTRTSSTVGTLAYMAPEQIQGGEVDRRSDMFSFGVVLFEMLTSHMPFRGDHEAALMYSILNEEAGPVQKYRPEVSPEFDRIIRRALEKDPADRYQHIDDMVSELRHMQKQSARVVRPESSQSSTPHRAGKNPRSSRTKLWIGMGAVIVAVGIVGVAIVRNLTTGKEGASSGRKMLVVLPFDNLGTQEQEYFADGLTEEITSKLSGLGVIARSSAMQYKKTSKSLKQIGDELGVSYILQGTIRWEEENSIKRVRVDPQLINVSDGTQIWSQSTEAVLSGAFKIQSDIATQVANTLNITLLQDEKQSLETKPTNNADAYDRYLRGNEYLYRGTGEGDYRIAEQMFQQAVGIDPNFALAYARLANTHAGIYAEKSLQLDPQLSDSHGAMGWYYYHCLREYDKAIEEFDKALRIQPNNFDVLLGLGSVYRRRGDFEEGIRQVSKALEVEPRSSALLGFVAESYGWEQKYAEADSYFERTVQVAPNVAEWQIEYALYSLLNDGTTQHARQIQDEMERRKIGRTEAWGLYAGFLIDRIDGKYRDAIEHLEHSGDTVLGDQELYIPMDLAVAQLLDLLKDFPQAQLRYRNAQRLLIHEIAIHPDDSRLHSSLGMAYAGLGRKEDAIREGQQAVDLLPLSKDALIGAERLEDLARIIYYGWRAG